MSYRTNSALFIHKCKPNHKSVLGAEKSTFLNANRSPEQRYSSPADDLLVGAAAIAEFLFGRKELRSRVYYLCDKGQIPYFRLGTSQRARIYSFKSDLTAWANSKRAIGCPSKAIDADGIGALEQDLLAAIENGDLAKLDETTLARLKNQPRRK